MLTVKRSIISSQIAFVNSRFGNATPLPLPANETSIKASSIKNAPPQNTHDSSNKVVDEQAHQTKPKKKKSALAQWLHGMMKSTINVGIMLSAVVGGGYMYDQAVGDQNVPVFQTLIPKETKSGLPKHLDALLDTNTTSRFQPGLSLKRMVPENGKMAAEQGYQYLQPSLSIVRQVVPEIADWYATMQQDGRLVFGTHERAEKFYGADVYAAYDQIRGTLNIGPAFWDMSELDKAANLVHEFRHAKQNMPKVISDRLGQALTLRILSDECRIEDEAYLYQEAFYRALGRPASFDVQAYLQSRGLMPQGKEKFVP